MTSEWVHAVFVDDSGDVSLAQLAHASGLSEEDLRDLVECGAFAPVDAGATSWTFSTQCVVTARTAYRLREQLALDDAHSVAVVLRLVQRIEALELELGRLRRRR
jgi:chaperone modulatory protein CbpM